jgi:thioredoxin reductase (NADPH)
VDHNGGEYEVFDKSSVYDTLIIGGGPAGISAALHLAFHKREVIIVDRRTSPMNFHTNPVNNYLGIKPLITGKAILNKMRSEVKEYGVTIHTGNVIEVTGEYPEFKVRIQSISKAKDTLVLRAKTLVFATGIARKHPTVKGEWRKWLPYAAKNEISYYCPDCETPLTKDKDILIVNVSTVNDTLYFARCLAPFAKRVRIFQTEDSFVPFTDEAREILENSEVEWASGLIENVIIEKPGEKQKLITSKGETFECDHFFVSWTANVRSELADKIGIELDRAGNIITDKRGKTNIAGIWAAGDVRPITQSVAMAVGSGNYAGIMINKFLRDES